jgi:hypothetical protein
MEIGKRLCNEARRIHAEAAGTSKQAIGNSRMILRIMEHYRIRLQFSYT